MRRRILSGIAPVAALWSIVLLCAALGSVRAAADNSRWGANYFPNVTMTTQDGVEVKFYDDVLKGKIVAINLIYTTCKYACPLETARLAQVQKVLGDRMGRDIFFYSITIDPDHDTPAVLKEYAEKYHVGPGWTFLTGKKDDIELISKKLGLYSDPDPANLDGHTPMLLVGNEATGQWMRNSAVDNPRFIATTIGDWLESWQTRSKTPVKSYAEAPTLTLDRGQYTFKNHCSACHTIGNGMHIGPDLAGVTSTRDRDWLMRFIVAPDKVRAAGDPIALALRAKFKQVLMPNLDMGGDDAAVLIDYIDRQTRAVQADAAASKAATSAAVAPAASLKPLVDPYLRIQLALNADGLDGVANDARTIASEAARLGASAASIQSAAAAMSQAADLKAARVVMAALGDALMSYAKESGASIGDDVKVAYCPMVQKYWLQKGDTIRNPFYGKQMSDCGRITPDLPTLK
jgi:protein SCO1/2